MYRIVFARLLLLWSLFSPTGIVWANTAPLLINSAVNSTSTAGNKLDYFGIGGIDAKVIDIKGRAVSLATLGDINIEGGSSTTGSGNPIRTTARASTLTGDTVSLTGAGQQSNIDLNNIKINSTGKTKIVTTGDLEITPGTNYSYDYWTTSSKSGPRYNRKTTTTEHVREYTTAAASEINAGDIDINVGGDAVFNTVKLNSQSNVNVEVVGDLQYLASKNLSHVEDNSHTTNSLAMNG